MKTCYVDRETRSIADLVAPGELTFAWTITRINVPHRHRGQGLGSTLLKQILEDADRDGVVLALEPAPSDGLDYDALRAWYERHGFRLNLELGYMFRRPQPPRDTLDGRTG